MNGRTRFLTWRNSLSGYLVGDGERSAGVGEEASWTVADVRLGCGLSEFCSIGSKDMKWRE